MSVQFRGSGALLVPPLPNGALAEVSPGTGALRVEARGADVGTNGSYVMSAMTGDLTGIAARTATAGFLFAFRWTSSSQIAIINKLKVRWYTNAGFTGAQLVGVSAWIARQFAIAPTAPAAIVTTGDNFKKRASYGSSNVGSVQIATTTALTVSASSFVLDPQPIMAGYARELADAATIPKQSIVLAQEWDIGQSMPPQLTQNMGIVVANEVLMAAGGTARVVVDIDWSEVSGY